MRPDYAGCDGVAPGVIQGRRSLQTYKRLIGLQANKLLVFASGPSGKLEGPCKNKRPEAVPLAFCWFVGCTGFEPVAPTLSR